MLKVFNCDKPHACFINRDATVIINISVTTAGQILSQGRAWFFHIENACFLKWAVFAIRVPRFAHVSSSPAVIIWGLFDSPFFSKYYTQQFAGQIVKKYFSVNAKKWYVQSMRNVGFTNYRMSDVHFPKLCNLVYSNISLPGHTTLAWCKQKSPD